MYKLKLADWFSGFVLLVGINGGFFSTAMAGISYEEKEQTIIISSGAYHLKDIAKSIDNPLISFWIILRALLFPE